MDIFDRSKGFLPESDFASHFQLLEADIKSLDKKYIYWMVNLQKTEAYTEQNELEVS